MNEFAWERNPPFNVTRASHVVLTSADLGATRAFYGDFLGFDVKHQSADALYLRGMEERVHHSLVFERAGKDALCEAIGLHVQTDEDLDKAFKFFDAYNGSARWIDRPFQGRTLRVRDAAGMPLELCAMIEQSASHLQDFHLYRSACPMRLDHFQVATSDVRAVTEFYMSLGFRLTEYTAGDKDDMWGTWLQRKGNPHDVVFTNGTGPRLHHFAYAVSGALDIIRVCDVAAGMGFASRLERGPGRHGIGNALFVYFRDPDGHRVEFFDAHYQTIDIGHKPLRWDLADTRRSQLWGMPATKRWFQEATLFRDTEVLPPVLKGEAVTLEMYLANHA